jgi:hypothetical protein
MNDARDPAAERLLDAALEQVLGGRAHAAPPPRQRWLAAALVLLGISVVVALWSEMRGARRAVPVPAAQGAAQDGAQGAEPQAPLPPMVTAKGRAALDALPADTQNLNALLDAPADISAFARFTKLRQLAFGASGPSPPWRNPPADLLTVLASLPALEDLILYPSMDLSPEHLRPLQAAPRLRAMQLVYCAGTPALADALTALPRLRELGLRDVAVDAYFVKRLAAMPLQRLHLWRCRGVDARVLEEVASMRSLAALELVGVGMATDAFAPKSWRLDAAAMARLGSLPELRELRLESCELDDATLVALPKQLHALSLVSRLPSAMRPGAFEVVGEQVGQPKHLFSALRPLGELRELTIDVWEEDGAAALAATLGALRLETLHLAGVVTPALVDAIAAQPELASLVLVLSGLAGRGSQLERVASDQPPSAPKEHTSFPARNTDFAPLRRCPRLQRVVLQDFDPFDAVSVKIVLGDRIAVETGNGNAIELPKSGPQERPEAAMAWARTDEELAKLPATTERLTFLANGPRDLSRLARFASLRELWLQDRGGGQAIGPAHPLFQEFWAGAGEHALAELAKLKTLELLALPELPQLQPSWLAPLKQLPKLRSLSLSGCAGTPALAAALTALPQLRELGFTGATLDADFLAGLRPLPLSRLSLWFSPRFDARAQKAIAGLRGLISLELHVLALNDPKCLPVDRDAFAAICAIPTLRELSFGTEGGEEPLLALLPDSLTKLDLHTWQDAASIAGLRRLARLRDLTVKARDDAAADALGDLVDALRLQRFATGAVTTPKLLRALGRQPDLASVELHLRQGTDLSPLAGAPQLRDVTLVGYGAFPVPTDYHPTLADVAPLADCKALRRLRLINFGLGCAEVQAAVGTQVELVVEEHL